MRKKAREGERGRRRKGGREGGRERERDRGRQADRDRGRDREGDRQDSVCANSVGERTMLKRGCFAVVVATVWGRDRRRHREFI